MASHIQLSKMKGGLHENVTLNVKVFHFLFIARGADSFPLVCIGNFFDSRSPSERARAGSFHKFAGMGGYSRERIRVAARASVSRGARAGSASGGGHAGPRRLRPAG